MLRSFGQARENEREKDAGRVLAGTSSYQRRNAAVLPPATAARKKREKRLSQVGFDGRERFTVFVEWQVARNHE